MSSNKRQRTNDPETIIRWFNEASSGSESSANEEGSDYEEVEEVDETHESIHDSNSEQGTSDEEDTTPSPETSGYFFAKDGTIKLKKQRPSLNVRTRAHNLIVNLPGCKEPARGKNSMFECLELFLSATIVMIIVSCTNIYISRLKDKFARESDVRETNATEIRALIGILYLIIYRIIIIPNGSYVLLEKM